jgi:hypothetical protein
MSRRKITLIKDSQKFKMNLIGENNIVQFIGSTPGIILTLICAIISFYMFVSIILSMNSGEND